MNFLSGIYFHIPFCISRCSYCDFFSTTFQDNSLFEKYQNAIFDEFKRKFSLVNQENLVSIYFGGGTPSLIKPKFFAKISQFLAEKGIDIENLEFTIEANPADLNEGYLENLRKSGVNRLSIGIQAFDDDILKIMGRRDRISHISQVLRVVPKFFDNFSFDFIYGIGENRKIKEEFERIFEIAVPKHISAYSYMKPNNLLAPKIVCEDEIIRQENEIFNFLNKKGFRRYEISNFALKGFESKHNLLYWQWGNFLGIGAGAHSFLANRQIRGFYENNVKKFIEKPQFIQENLSKKELIEDFLLMGLRVVAGFSQQQFFDVFGLNFKDLFSQKFLNQLVVDNLILLDNNSVRATQKGMNFLNEILTKMFVELENFNDWRD